MTCEPQCCQPWPDLSDFQTGVFAPELLRMDTVSGFSQLVVAVEKINEKEERRNERREESPYKVPLKTPSVLGTFPVSTGESTLPVPTMKELVFHPLQTKEAQGVQ